MSINRKKEESTGFEVAVIGMAGRFPGAKNIRDFWSNLANGVENISFFTDAELEEAGVGKELLQNPNFVKAKGIIGEVEYFDAAFFGYTPNEARIMDPQIRIFSECVWEALEDAGYNPYTYKGLIGLYAGAGLNYYWKALALSSNTGNTAEQFNQAQLLEKDFMTTRISHNLNLKGPSISISTACSTSLVAIHMACRSLLTGDSNIALAGGVTINLPQKKGYLYQEGMINSPDGHCRAFDAQAKGTVGGEGAGVVALKLLKKALLDKDHIYAVIKGTAINNDGFRKVGYTAPSVEGQADVIQTALRIGRVEPESVTYIETHGTGTALGDPVEIEALKIAFHTDKKQFCRIGAVKTNIGHTDTAAGIAGFIKTVLALCNRQIPPSLHYQTPNPRIDFENSPFLVNTQLVDWKNDAYPLRAGVSSFGIGGTNAHVVLEEAPEPEITLTNRPWQLVTLSAKTQTALQQLTLNLQQFLKDNTLVNFSDVAYTLNVGRAPFQYRRMVVATDLVSAMEKLSATAESYIVTDKNPELIFMFPGQGSQYLNMGRELYETEPVFQEEFNRCGEILAAMTPFDIRTVLFPDGSNNSDEKSINDTVLAQPVIFSFEYAFARLLIKWGIKPQAMIGHSIGEYVAATLAEVFSLEDALSLIVCRGELMQEMDGGGMISVPLSEKEIRPYLENDLSLAAENSPSMCVVSGTNEALERFMEKLKQHGITGIRLNVSHAFHSMMMEPVLPKFQNKLRQIKLHPPTIPYLSNLTGNWITAEEAASPDYWARHLRNTVRFADGINKLLGKNRLVMVEVGGGRSLSGLVRQSPLFSDKDHLVVNATRHPSEKNSDVLKLLTMVGRLWCQGVSIDWDGYYELEKHNRLSLPTYPFERQYFWIEGNPMPEPKVSGAIDKKTALRDWFYLPTWKKTQPVVNRKPDEAGKTGKITYLALIGDAPFALRFVKRLQAEKVTLIVVKPGPEFAELEPDIYEINPENPMDYEQLFHKLHMQNRQIPQKIIHLGSIASGSAVPAENGLEDYLRKGFYSLIYLAKAIGKVKYDRARAIDMMVVSNNTQSITGEETIIAEKATVLGPCKVIPQEYPGITCRYIDLILPEPESNQETTLLDLLVNELHSRPVEPVVAYRGRQRWSQIYEPFPEDIAIVGDLANDLPVRLRERGAYLITGGLGKIGLLMAKNLARTIRARLILIGRSSFPERGAWEEWLANHTQNDVIYQKIAILKELETLGAEVLVFTSDLSSKTQLETIISQVEGRFGQINGIIHAAGVMTGAPIADMTKTDCQNCFQAKINGLINLRQVFYNREPDFCLLMSSLASILGGIGYAAYAAANIFMDTFAQQVNLSNTTQWLSVNWDAWSFNANHQLKPAFGSSIDSLAITPEEGIDTFTQLVKLEGIPQVIISTGDIKARLSQWINPENLQTSSERASTEPGQLKVSFFERPADLSNPYIAPDNEVEIELARVWKEVLGFDPVGIQDNFFELGGNSLKAMQIIANLKTYQLSTADIFKYQTIAELSLAAKPVNAIQPVLDETSARAAHSTVSALGPDTSQEKKLPDIQPFNDVLYMDCFNNAFFPVVFHFKRSILPVISNDVMIYHCDQLPKGVKIVIKTISTRPITEIAADLCIKSNTKIVSDNIVGDLIHAISLERPASVYIDCFYEPFRNDTFQKQHWPHAILVYGFNLKEQTFDILEHSELNILDYKSRAIHFSDMANAYHGYLLNFQKGEQNPSFFEFSKDTGQSAPAREIAAEAQLKHYQRIFLENFRANSGQIRDGLQSVRIFTEYYQTLIQDEINLNTKLEELLVDLNQVIKVKLAERYALSNLFGAESRLLEHLELIVNNWIQIRGVLEKYQLTLRYRPVSMQKSLAALFEIIEAEQRYINQLMEYTKHPD